MNTWLVLKSPTTHHSIIGLALLILGFFLGYVANQNNQPAVAKHGTILRSSGYQFVSPVLFSDFGNDITTPVLKGREEEIEKQIDGMKSSTSLKKMSVYYRNLNTSQQVVVDNGEKYFPASLSKLPLAMAYYKLDEASPGLLDTSGELNFEQDYNANQEIGPQEFPVSGQSYSIRQLIEMMLKYSDNTSFNLLLGRSEATDTLRKLFSDIKLFYPYDQTEVKEVFNVKEIGRFYRLLHNATYLNAANSESLLQQLTQSTYKQAIVGGVPQEVKVAHKYGLETQRDMQGNLVGRQLHDCGIVYTPNNPYLLCIMTKSGAGDLSQIEQDIAKISKLVYDQHIASIKKEN